MDKAVKQRLVGGLVLIAGAALFLPMLLDGSGAELVVPPVPAPPVVAGVEALQPRLEAEVVAAGQAVDEAQAGPVFHDVTPAAPEAAVVEDTPPDEAYHMAEAAAPVAAPAVKAPAPVTAAETAAKEKLAADAARLAAQKAEAEKLLRDKAEKERLARLAAEQKAKEAAEAKLKAVATKPVAAPAKPPAAPAKPAADLPQAWVVQVASLSAREKADELVARLRSKGYRATAVYQTSMWKVVVGPELRKEVAESIKQRLAADPELRLSGWVQAWKP